jgi:N-acyl-D-aspartate/D-glutamate deacylase
MFDLVIRDGLVADGDGGDPIVADVAVAGGVVAAVGRGLSAGRREVDAEGCLVTPGFVDIHTHYDGQVMWSDRLMPSSTHGVTTIVTGNCGVGFAPCRPQDRDALIGLMAGVEDIPEVVMAEGLNWSWRSYGEYLEAIDLRPHDIDIASLLPHSPLRVYVMGDRAIRRENATPEDIARMAAIARDAMRAGALGFASSRAVQHRSIDGEPIPTVRAAEDELMGIALALRDTGAGVLQFLSDFHLFRDVEGEFAMLRRLVAASGRPMSFTLQQKHSDPDGWRHLLRLTEAAAAAGLPIKAQVAVRPTGVLLGHALSMTPFSHCSSYKALASLPWWERLARLRQHEVRAEIVEEAERLAVSGSAGRDFGRMFVMSDRPDYEPSADRSIASLAARRGVSPQAAAYDALLEEGGHAILFEAAQNYANHTLGATAEMLRHPDTVIGLGDGGAHLGLICDASYPTTVLGHWVRDRQHGRFSIGWAVKALASDTAAAVGLGDRGRLRPGYKADINIIDPDRVALRKPRVVCDLPAGGRRILQDAEGYRATFVSGVQTYQDGEPTGDLPGQLVRGAGRLAAAA